MRILNLGAGQQSTAVYLLAANREIEPIDFALFADTGEEPIWVYETLDRLESIPGGAPILRRALLDESGQPIRLGDMLMNGRNERFATIPAFVKHLGQFVRGGKNAQGRVKRQCTSEFKIDVIERTIREELLGLKRRQAYKGPRVVQLFGFDRTEGGRIVDMQERLKKGRLASGEFPLYDRQWSRLNCQEYNASILGDGVVLPSACTFCPLIRNHYRRLIRDRDPKGFERACQVDDAFRNDAVTLRHLDGELYVHRKMIPLRAVNLDDDDGQFDFGGDCAGFCGH